MFWRSNKISANTPPDVANAQIRSWQRSKELDFLEELGSLMRRHEKSGLEKRRFARVIVATGKALEKVA